MKKLFSIILSVLVSSSLYAQLCTVSGTVIDTKAQQPLPGAMAVVLQDDSQPKGTTTDMDGAFSFHVKPGKYTFRVTYLGYTTYEKVVDITGDWKAGVIRLKPEDKQLKEVKAVGVMKRQEQRGDTTIFNAEAFKVNPDATTEDLIKKMPGMQVSGNSVTSGGETVKKVLVDGKEYFGSDPMAALRNISADMVSQIEVYDRQSDQSQFTGFSDGNEERTINILTKMGITKGRFGRVYAGYGTDNRYEMGGNMNFFRGDQRFSVIGMLNNINQQNFSFSDFSDAMSNMGGMGMGGGMFSRGNGGKNRTGSIGVNYSVEKTDTIKIEFSYMYKNNKNVNNSNSLNEYPLENEDDSLRIYNSESDYLSKTNEHTTTLRLTWTIDKRNSIIFTPRISWNNTRSNSLSEGIDSYDGNLFSHTCYDSESKQGNVSGQGYLMWRHKFLTDHRTLSINLSGNVRNADSDQTSNNNNDYKYMPNLSIVSKQVGDSDNKSLGLNASVMYTEPLGEYMALQFNYSPSYTKNEGNKMQNADTISVAGVLDTKPMEFSPLLSNKKTSEYNQQKGGIGLNFFKGKELNASIGVDIQQAMLSSEQIYPQRSNTEKSFTSVLPSFNIRYRSGRTFNINARYRARTSAPSVNQLQNVVDVSNARQYSGGNENLSQSYTHNLNVFMMRNNPETSRGIFFRTNFSTTKDYIATSSVIATKDTVIDLGIVLPATVQYDKPVNINGYWNFSSNFTFSTPVQWLGSNVNFNVGANMSSTPSLYNGKKVKSDNFNLNGGVTIGSSFSENVDFTVSYNGAENIVRSTKVAKNNYNYYSHTISADLNCLFFTRLVFANNLSHQYTNGMDNGSTSGGGYDRNYISWNAAVACKFFADRRGELRLKFNDILNNTSSISRSINNGIVTTSETDVLRRYAMLTFTYKFKPKGERKQNGFGFPEPPKGMRMGPPPGGGQPPMF
ncbi:MAG: outer membrane beta-barrel protein [Bacteroidales bacterium]|nr:outer membrane beta-barrel protein [Bacteroidales bacterium]